jgi:uncharacterized RDD family membrane protein YckC
MAVDEEIARTSVAPPRWVPAGAPVAASSANSQGDERADAAVRWRIGAAIIDNLLVYGGYFGLCGLLGWRVTMLGHAWVLLLGAVAYHFVLESRSGQTIGKRRYGIRVVSLDGGPAGARAIATRSVLRIIDQLPVWYLSGLVSMVRTGPARRQRIGDVAAGTMVVAVDRHAAEHGTPSWLLPAATLFATAVSVIAVWSMANAGSQPLTSRDQAQFLAGCQNSPGGQLLDCGCLLTRLEADGYDTPNDLANLFARAQTLTVQGVTNPARIVLLNAARACRR